MRSSTPGRPVRRAAFVLAPALSCLLLAGAAAPSKKPEGSPKIAFGPKPFGVLLYSSAGGGDWRKLTGDLRNVLEPKIPFETLSGSADRRGVQRALDRLQAAKVRKIVVIPLQLRTRNDDADQLQYLLGLSKFPSKAFMTGWRMSGRVIPRAKAKVPIVMGKGLDDDPVVADILLVRAKAMSRDPKKESVVLVAQAGAEEEDESLKSLLQGHAKRLAEKGGFHSVRAEVLPSKNARTRGQREESGHPELRLGEKTERIFQARTPMERLKARLRALSRRTHVLVLPFLLERDGSERLLRKNLDNIFFRWKGEALMPHDGLVRWVHDQIEATRKLENMVRFKDEGLATPAQKRR